jgi:hypothetical protein
MRTRYKAQWIPKSRCESLRKSQRPREVLLLDTFEGFIIVQPAGKSLGDGPVLSPDECDYELRPAWYAGPIARLAEARQRLGLGADFARKL